MKLLLASNSPQVGGVSTNKETLKDLGSEIDKSISESKKPSKKYDDDYDDDDYDDDEEMDYYSGGSDNEKSTDQENLDRIYQHAKRMKSKFKLQPDDTIFGIISKTYMTTGLRKLVGKRARRIRKKALPSLKRKHSVKKKSAF